MDKFIYLNARVYKGSVYRGGFGTCECYRQRVIFADHALNAVKLHKQGLRRCEVWRADDQLRVATL